MVRKIVIITFCCFLFNNKVYAEVINLNEEKSRVNYIFSYLGDPVKKKFLPAMGYIDIEKGRFGDNGESLESRLLKELNLDVKFTSMSAVFKKAIDFDKYPDFKFWTELENPIQLVNENPIELEGFLSFHGVTEKVKINLKNEMTKEGISLIGFFSIKMTDFGIIPPRVFFIVLDDVIKTKVELFAKVPF